MPLIPKQKTVVSVELLCFKCRRKVMKLVATLEGITSIVLDPSKSTVTVIGEADPVDIINKIRKFRKSAMIVSTGSSKDNKDDTKKDSSTSTMSTALPQMPSVCQRCDVWYVLPSHNYCSIM
ncbi:hypothetical protein SAY87_012028 [Trapa incisa]|uniref:HMA domain-containing protein n=1 Tax=Trapa incisa TaxID=236973 RepID=A0AAN7JBV4_9MYRT|nr:hypothetical protein SAY87_012028 [Trapa incisa]